VLGALSLLIPDHNHDITALSYSAVGLAVVVFSCWVILPHTKMPDWLQSVPPFLFLLIVALLRYADGGPQSGYTALVAVPVVWMALHGTKNMMRWTVAGVGCIFVVPYLVSPDGLPFSVFVRSTVLWVGSAAIIGDGIFRLRNGLETLSRQRHELLESLEEGIVAYGADGEIVEANSSSRRLLGVKDSADLDLAALRERVISTDHEQHNRLPMETTLHQHVAVLREQIEVMMPHGSPRWFSFSSIPIRDRFGTVRGVAASFSDVTLTRAASLELAHQATHDSLTGLGNRRSLMGALALLEKERSTHRSALLYLDLDGFKGINDTYGHDIGDRVLAHVGRLLAEHLRTEDRAFRLGGDEFVILLPAIETTGQATMIAERLVHAVEDSTELGGITVALTASVGIAIGSPTDDSTALLTNADRALYDAKRQGKNRARLSQAHSGAQRGGPTE
jgi:diguanylate cyclase (GGDEF)-like protein/PAS domain S-box-containing protein